MEQIYCNVCGLYTNYSPYFTSCKRNLITGNGRWWRLLLLVKSTFSFSFWDTTSFHFLASLAFGWPYKWTLANSQKSGLLLYAFLPLCHWNKNECGDLGSHMLTWQSSTWDPEWLCETKCPSCPIIVLLY